MTYSEKLKDPRWQRKRLEIMQRDSFKCQECKSDKITLNVHHKKYIKGNNPWEYSDDNFQTLCENCHINKHKKQPHEENLIEYFYIAKNTREQSGFISLDKELKKIQESLKEIQESLKEIDPNNSILLESTIKKFIEIQKKLRNYGK